LRKITASLLIALATSLAAPDVRAAEKFPASWRRTMSNDPGVNSYLVKYTAPLGAGAAGAIRNVMLARMLGALCQGSATDKKIVGAHLTGAGVAALAKDELKAQAFLAEASLRGFDYRALAHLCAGTDYLFGSEGVMIAKAVKPGKGEPKKAYDPANPYILLPAFKP